MIPFEQNILSESEAAELEKLENEFAFDQDFFLKEEKLRMEYVNSLSVEDLRFYYNLHLGHCIKCNWHMKNMRDKIAHMSGDTSPEKRDGAERYDKSVRHDEHNRYLQLLAKKHGWKTSHDMETMSRIRRGE